MWFQLAAKLGMSVQRAKAETTSTEFLLWQKRLADEANDFHRWDSYLAEICFQIYLLRKSFSGGKVELSAKDFLMKFAYKESSPSGGDKSPEEKLKDVEALKGAILGAFGFAPTGERVQKVQLSGDAFPSLRTRKKPG